MTGAQLNAIEELRAEAERYRISGDRHAQMARPSRGNHDLVRFHGQQSREALGRAEILDQTADALEAESGRRNRTRVIRATGSFETTDTTTDPVPTTEVL